MTEVPEHLLEALPRPSRRARPRWWRRRRRRRRRRRAGRRPRAPRSRPPPAPPPPPDRPPSRPAEVAPEPAKPPSGLRRGRRSTARRSRCGPCRCSPFLPLWAIVYAKTLVEAAQPRVLSQLDAGAAASTRPSARAATAPTASAAPAVRSRSADGEVVKTFPNIAGQLEFVWLGAARHPAAQGHALRRPQPGGRPAHRRGSSTAARCRRSRTRSPRPSCSRSCATSARRFGGEKVPAKQIAPDGSLLWPNGKPYPRRHRRARQPRRQAAVRRRRQARRSDAGRRAAAGS